MTQHHTGPHAVFRKRQHQSTRAQVTPEEQALHEEAKKQYPLLSLSPGEYVLETVRRHPIGLIAIWAVVGCVQVSQSA